MTEIPEHLRKRAEATRISGRMESSPTMDDRIPPHLAERVRQRNARSQSGGDVDPFAAQRQSEEAIAQRLLDVKASLIASVGILRSAVELPGAALTVKGQFLRADQMKGLGSFTPPRDPNVDVYFTLYSQKETFIDVEGGTALRVGEAHALRMPIEKRKLGAVFKQAGVKPLRSAAKLGRDGYLFAEGEKISSELVEQALGSAVTARMTNSAALYEGDATKQAYNDSYGNRYGASVSVVRNPAGTPEDRAIFGVGLISLTDSYNADEGFADHSGLYDPEIVGSRLGNLPFARSRPSAEALGNILDKAGAVIDAFGVLAQAPTRVNASEVFRRIDERLDGSSRY